MTKERFNIILLSFLGAVLAVVLAGLALKIIPGRGDGGPEKTAGAKPWISPTKLPGASTGPAVD